MNRRSQVKKATGYKTAVVIVLGCVGFVQFGITSWGAEDARRFLAVTNWYATFTRTLQSSGTYTEPATKCVYTWSFSHAGGISSQLKTLIPPLPGIDPVWSDVGDTNIPLNFSIQDRSSETCGDDTDTYEATTGPSLGVIFWCDLKINVAATNYTLEPGYFVGPYTGTVNGDPFPGSAVAWFPPTQLITNPIVEPLPASGMVLQGSRRYSLSQLDYQDAAPVLTIAAAGTPIGTAPQALTGELVLTWTLTPLIEEVEVLVESDDYENWLPLGDLRDWNKAGTNLFFTARLQTKDGQVPQSRAKTVKFELLDVSSEPGVCMNRPIAQFANTNPDLRFESRINQPPLVVPALSIQDGGMTAATPEGEYAAVTAGISSFDFGAYGKLKVTAEVNGKEIIGYWKNDPAKEQKPLLLPKRKPTSWIADKWKEDQGVSDLSDTDDEENEPVGDTHKGDGLSLYEEYRGFSENLKHIRANPKKKDLFVCDRIGNAISTAGISLFADQSGLNVHSRMRPEEFNVHASGTFDTMINFNHSPSSPRVVDQHGVLLRLLDSDPGYSYSAGEYGGTPAASGPILITPAAFADGGWQNVELSNGGRVLTFGGASTVAHELAHTCAVWHHGQGDETVSWEGTTTPDGRTVIKENFQEIIEFYEDGGKKAEVTGSEIVIGVMQGEHSGDADCFMRYIDAAAYRSRDNLRVRYVVEEVEGTHLCTSPTGTGVNAAGRSPQSRYGDAAAKRGNCKGQICVNDRYNFSAPHRR